MQADPLGLVDGASVYGYVVQNPLRFIDPTGEEVYVVCRPLRVVGIFDHCALFIIPERECSCDGDSDTVQFSLGGGDTRFNENTGTNSADLRAFRSQNDKPNRRNRGWPYGQIYPVEYPPNLTICEFENSLIFQGNNYNEGPYNAWNGPNSNSAVSTTITNAGGTPPVVSPRARKF